MNFSRQTFSERRRGSARVNRPGVLFAVGFLVLASGCNHLQFSSGVESTYIPGPSSIGLDRDPSGKSVITVAGLKVPARLEFRRQKDDYVIDIFQEGSLFETEKYLVSSESWSVAELSGACFEPPIPLLDFNATLQPQSSWKGKLGEGEVSFDATADIRRTIEKLTLDGIDYDTIKTSTVLTLISEKDKSIRREMALWVTKGGGIIKRSFGASVRESLPNKSSSANADADAVDAKQDKLSGGQK